MIRYDHPVVNRCGFGCGNLEDLQNRRREYFLEVAMVAKIPSTTESKMAFLSPPFGLEWSGSVLNHCRPLLFFKSVGKILERGS